MVNQENYSPLHFDSVLEEILIDVLFAVTQLTFTMLEHALEFWLHQISAI